MSKYLYLKTVVYRKAWVYGRRPVLLAVAWLALLAGGQAQFRIAPPERTTPRALGVLETYKNGSRRLIPVSFYFEKRYYDAAMYHATPVPFTLYSETLYEVEHFGKPLGTFTVQSATLNQAEWFGNGRFKPLADASTLGRKKLAKVVVEDSTRPVLHRREGSEGDTPPAHPSAEAAAKNAADDEDPDRPKLHRRAGSEGEAGGGQGPTAGTAAAGTGTTTQVATGASTTGTGATTPVEESSGQDPDRPKLQRRDSGTAAGSGSAGGGTTASTSSGTSGTAGTSAAGAGTATAGGSAGTPATASSGTSTGTSSTGTSAGAVGTTTSAPASAVAATKESAEAAARAELRPSDDPDHPILRRGKPVQAQGGRDLPDLKLEEPVTRQVAVSDAGPASSSYEQELVYVCPEPERQQLEAEARELAQQELRRLAQHRGLTLPEGLAEGPASKNSAGSAGAGAKTVAAKTSTTGTSATKTSTAGTKKPAAALSFEDEQFVPYDLDYNNYAVVFYSARYAASGGSGANGLSAGELSASGSKAAGSNAGAATGQAAAAVAPAGSPGRSWVVTVIGRVDSDGKLIKLYSAVSDPRELDLYPEVRLVDAVDPDGYGRHALLLREKKRDGVSWLLGRVTGYELQTLFETAAR